MNGIQNFEGDLLLYDTPDGGEVALESGLFVSDKQFSTAVYLSLFGGNEEDPGKVKNNQEWWGNLLDVSESEKLKSRFQYIVSGLPMTVKNIKEAETAAQLDLQWFISEKIADEIYIYGQATGKNRFNLTVEIMKDTRSIFKNVYSLQWGVDNGGSV
jgi:phage gp46-like protein